MNDRLSNALSSLALQHAGALKWFEANVGVRRNWPQPLSDGTLLVCKAKGIYKPKWTGYALSVRRMLRSPYRDGEFEMDARGRWTCYYFQENLDPLQRDSEFTNRGLVRCLRDGVPVGVLRQLREGRPSQYEIMGLAFVEAWKDGAFVLRR